MTHLLYSSAGADANVIFFTRKSPRQNYQQESYQQVMGVLWSKYFTPLGNLVIPAPIIIKQKAMETKLSVSDQPWTHHPRAWVLNPRWSDFADQRTLLLGSSCVGKRWNFQKWTYESFGSYKRETAIILFLSNLFFFGAF